MSTPKKFGRAYHRRYYQLRRKKLIDHLGGRCAVCGKTEDLHIDHVEKDKKAFAISHKMSIKNNVEELKKCQLLCSEHHHEKTAQENRGITHGKTTAWMRYKCRCDICEVARRKWYLERNRKRREQTARVAKR